MASDLAVLNCPLRWHNITILCSVYVYCTQYHHSSMSDSPYYINGVMFILYISYVQMVGWWHGRLQQLRLFSKLLTRQSLRISNSNTHWLVAWLVIKTIAALQDRYNLRASSIKCETNTPIPGGREGILSIKIMIISLKWFYWNWLQREPCGGNVHKR